METLLSIFAEIDDPRDHRARYPLSAMLFIALASNPMWRNCRTQNEAGCLKQSILSGTLQLCAIALPSAPGCVLAPDEPADVPWALAEAEPVPAVLLHLAADEALAGRPSDYASLLEVSHYIETARNFQPSDVPWLANHCGHFIKLKDVERPLITAGVSVFGLYRSYC